MKNIIWPCLAAALLTACGSGSSPGAVASQYLEGILNGNEAVKKYESAAMDQGFLAGLSMMTLFKLVDQDRRRDPNFKMQVKIAKVSEANGTAAVDLVTSPAGNKDGQGIPCTAKLQDEKKNGWMVVGLSCFAK